MGTLTRSKKAPFSQRADAAYWAQEAADAGPHDVVALAGAAMADPRA
jgi:hypothetical protein